MKGNVQGLIWGYNKAQRAPQRFAQPVRTCIGVYLKDEIGQMDHDGAMHDPWKQKALW